MAGHRRYKRHVTAGAVGVVLLLAAAVAETPGADGAAAAPVEELPSARAGTRTPSYPVPKPPAVKAPRNTSRPRISGRLREGSVLTGTRGSWSGTTPITYRYRWRRCDRTCEGIPNARNSSYRLKRDDVRKRIELAVTADNRAPGSTRVISARTNLVAPKRIRRIRARVVISGKVTSRGAKLTRFRIRAERGAMISIRCKGRGCPFKRLSRATPKGGLLRVRRLQRRLRGGIVVGVRVTRSFTIGKYTRFRIRDARVPLRIDRCLRAGRSRPVRCPR